MTKVAINNALPLEAAHAVTYFRLCIYYIAAVTTRFSE